MDETRNEGFLSRWSRRKSEARAGNEPSEPAVQGAAAPAIAQGEIGESADPQIREGDQAPRAATPVVEAKEGAEAPALTLADVAKLTRDSDFSRFVSSGVDTEVRNAALKKLFSDPHFNLMDGLDVYIDDYSVPSPLPQHLLVKMAQAKFLGLVKQKADEAVAEALSFRAEGEQSRPANADILRRAAQDGTDLPAVRADDANHAAPVPTVASAPPANSMAPHEDADLQLQPDDDPGRSGAAAGPGEDAGRQH